MLSQPAASVAERYDRGGLWIAVLLMLGTQVYVLQPVILGWRYGLVASGAVIWLVYGAVGGASAWIVLRGGGRSPALPWAACVILLAGVAVGSLAAPSGFFSYYNWPFTAAGWYALVALWRRSLVELIAFFISSTLVCLAALIALHETDRVSLARFISQAPSVCVLQIIIFAGARAVTVIAQRAAEAEDALARTRTVELAAEAVQAARSTRYETIRATVAHLLADLAAGRLDLADPAIRQQLAVAVTRLRRYLVETDEVPDPLSHELRACADAAERNGIAVDLLAPAGTIPPLPVEIRRALTEPIIQVLAVTATRARITVVAAPADVVVAIVADAQLAAPPQVMHESVQIGYDVEGELLWVQARWTGQSS